MVTKEQKESLELKSRKKALIGLFAMVGPLVRPLRNAVIALLYYLHTLVLLLDRIKD